MTHTGTVSHPLADALTAASQTLKSFAGTPLWSMPDGEVTDLIGVAAKLEAQIAAVKLAAIAEAHHRDLPRRAGARSTQAWLRGTLRLTPQAAKSAVVLAAAVERLDDTRAAVSQGRISTAHARVVADAVGELPPSVGPEVVQRAEAHLVQCAQAFDPGQVAALGRRIFEVIDPDTADAREAALLAEQDRHAHRRRQLCFTDDGRGTVHIRGRLDVASATVIRRAIDPLAKPRPTGTGLPDLRSPAARLADAWLELSQRALHAGDLPTQREEKPQIVVTIGHDQLRDQTGAGVTDTGDALSPGAVRRLACDAQIIPAVLGGASEVLDLGRSQRLFTRAQRRALILRDKGCAFPGCDYPPAWAEATGSTAGKRT